MSFPHSATRGLLRTLVIMSALLMVASVWAQSGSEKKVRKQRQRSLAQEAQSQGNRKRQKPKVATISGKSQPPPPTALPSKPADNAWQRAEDFDWSVSWERNDNRGVHPNMDYGYSSTNNLSPAGCAPGEIGGLVSSCGISWFADTVAGGSVMLDPNGNTLSASGWCKFDATGGDVAVGWFNGDTYRPPHAAPDSFIGWRQNGDALCAAVGHTGSSFVAGKAIALSNGSPFQWTLTYHPTGGYSGCGLVTLSVGGSSSMLSLTQEQREALSAGKLNRFGIVTPNTGENKASTVWLDNLVYTRISGLPVPHAAAMAHTRTDFFDTDPTGSTWFGVNNLTAHEPITVKQDYGYQSGGGGAGYEGASGGGCIGGLFSQAVGVSYYGYDYGDSPLHFTNRLRSEGYIQFPESDGENCHLGWTTKRGNGWREPNTFGFRFVRKGKVVNVSLDIATKTYQGAGGGGGARALPSVALGPQWHHYVLEYDPGRPTDPGTVKVQFDDKSKTFNLPDGKKDLGADFDLFGMWNHKAPAHGPAMKAYVDDIRNMVNGKNDFSTHHGATWIGDFAKDPSARGWVGCNNSFTKRDYIVRPRHQFGWVKSLLYLDGINGYSPMYNIVGSQRYCMGGIIYLSDFGMITRLTPNDPPNLNPPGDVPRACYGADLNGTLNARDHHMYATGKFKLDFALTDAAQLFGWYNAATATAPGDKDTTATYQIKIKDPEQLIQRGWTMPDKFLGVQIHGGSASGYSMMPGYRSPHLAGEFVSGSSDIRKRVYQDGEWRDFFMEYDPDGAGGKGQIKLQLGNEGEPFVYDLEKGAKGENADFAFDRFGLLTMRKGGGKCHAIYFDKLTYTVARKE